MPDQIQTTKGGSEGSVTTMLGRSVVATISANECSVRSIPPGT